LSTLDHFKPAGAIGRSLRNDLSALEARQIYAERGMLTERQLAQFGAAQSIRLRDMLRVIEGHNPDAALTASVFVRLAEGGMIAAALEFQAQV